MLVDGIRFYSQNAQIKGHLEKRTLTQPGTLATTTGKARWYARHPLTIETVYIAAGVAPLGSALTITIKKNGASVGSFALPDGANETAPLPTNIAVADGDFITVDVDSVGASVAGSDMTVELMFKKTV